MPLEEFFKDIEDNIHIYPWTRKECMQKPKWLDKYTINGYVYYFKTSKHHITTMKFEVDLNKGGIYTDVDKISINKVNVSKWNKPSLNAYKKAVDHYIYKYKWLETFYGKNKSIIHIYRHNKVYKINKDGTLSKDPNAKNSLWNLPKKK